MYILLWVLIIIIAIVVVYYIFKTKSFGSILGVIDNIEFPDIDIPDWD